MMLALIMASALAGDAEKCWAYETAGEHVPAATIADLDGDGRDESWSEEEGCGSGECSGSWMAQSDGRTVVSGEWSDSFSTMIGVEPIPAALAGPGNADARRLVERSRGMRVCDSADPGLAWLIRAVKGKPAVQWVAGSDIQTGFYHLVSDDAELAARLGTTAPFWLTYKGQTQTVTPGVSPHVIAEVDGRQLVRYAHGLVLVDAARDQYAWVWVSRANQKLRWPTLCDGAAVAGHTASVARLGSPESEAPGWLEVDLRSGRVAVRSGAGGPVCGSR